MNTHWKTGTAAFAVMMAAAGAMLACSNDSTAPQAETTYVAQLSGTNEVPATPAGAPARRPSPSAASRSATG
jgi:ABC-type glycerol-3-phosphate transport system substrate-binding protein